MNENNEDFVDEKTKFIVTKFEVEIATNLTSPQWKSTLNRQILGVTAMTFLCILGAMVSGFSGILFPQLQEANSIIKLTKNQESWIAAIAPLQMSLGCVFSSWTMDKFGRKMSNIGCVVLALVGWSLIYFSESIETLLCARVICGLYVGLSDIGANLTDSMYTGIYNGSKKHEEDLLTVLKRSWEAGLEKIIITGGNFQESIKALEIAKTSDRLYCTVGCHPTRCSEFEAEGETPENYLEKLRQLVHLHPQKVVAIGECGLDYDRTQFCPINVQKKYFEMQLKLCEDTQLPLFLHCRNAQGDLFDILKSYKRLTGVVHSFDGNLQEAQGFIDMGYYIGINGCSLKTNNNLETVKQLPIEKLMIETDCPWCEIRPSHAGYSLIDKNHFYESVKKEKWKNGAMVKSRNEPANIIQVLDVLSSIKNLDPDELASQIHKNTLELFFKR